MQRAFDWYPDGTLASFTYPLTMRNLRGYLSHHGNHKNHRTGRFYRPYNPPFRNRVGRNCKKRPIARIVPRMFHCACSTPDHTTPAKTTPQAAGPQFKPPRRIRGGNIALETDSSQHHEQQYRTQTNMKPHLTIANLKYFSSTSRQVRFITGTSRGTVYPSALLSEHPHSRTATHSRAAQRLQPCSISPQQHHSGLFRAPTMSMRSSDLFVAFSTITVKPNASSAASA